MKNSRYAVQAQMLYDLREKFGFCSGKDLQEFFRSELNGEPSPRGRVLISRARAMHFVRESIEAMEWNSPVASAQMMNRVMSFFQQ